MIQERPSTRRDPRCALRRGSSFVEFGASRDGALLTGELVAINVSGFAFEVDEGHGFERGVEEAGVVVRVGPSALEGDVVVRNTRPVGAGRVEVGCLFYPIPRNEERWESLVAGVEAATPD